MEIATQKLLLKLQTRQGVGQAIETLIHSYLTCDELLLSSEGKVAFLAALADAKTSLLTLQRQLSTGEYVVMEASLRLNGYGWTTYHYEPTAEDPQRERRRGHDFISSVVDLAKRLGQAVIIGDTIPEERRNWVARKLREAGVVAILDMDGDER